MDNKCIIELSLKGNWHDVAQVTLTGTPVQGTTAGTILEYLDDYVFTHLNRRDAAALSVNFPVNLEIVRLEHWPAFLTDLLPAGAHRRFWTRELSLAQGPASDWELLTRCSMNPIGNLRIKDAASNLAIVEHDGFSRDDVIIKKQGFLEYMRYNGAPVGGSSGAQGDAPKFLLTEDSNGRWHPSGSVAEEQIQREWLVKFPRGTQVVDKDILQAEKVYYDIAIDFGLRTGANLIYEDGCLFISRFDVKINHGKLIRIGVETLASVLGEYLFDTGVYQEKIIGAIKAVSTNPLEDLAEWLCRDILNVCLGNTDNHLRNTAFCRDEDGSVMLAPLYDFAPMALDPVGIIRVCRWHTNESAGIPEWHRIIGDVLGDEEMLHRKVEKILRQVHTIPDYLFDHGVAPAIIDFVNKTIKTVREINV